MPSSAEKRAAPPAAGQPARFALLFEELSLVLVLSLVGVVGSVAPPVVADPAESLVSLGYLLTAFVVVTLLLVILIRSRLGTRVMAGLMTVAVLAGVGLLVWRLGGPGASILAMSAGTILLLAWRRVVVYDAVLTLGLAGVAVDLGTALRPVAAAALLCFLAIYDIVAVYGTKHMVRAAEALADSKAPFALLVPPRWSALTERLDQALPQRGFLFLGTGDLVLPALLAAAARTEGVWPAVGVSVGAIAGLALTNQIFFSQKTRRPMPALPPVAAGAVVGYLIAALF